MSTLAVNTITNAAGGNTAQINGMTPTADSLQGFRNRIINGDMRIFQRGQTATGVTGTGYFTADRARTSLTGTGTSTVDYEVLVNQSVDGTLMNVLKSVVTTTDPARLVRYEQRVEPINVMDLSGKPVTLSFYAKADAALTLNSVFLSDNSTGNLTGVVFDPVELTTSWQRFVMTGTLDDLTASSFLSVTIGLSGNTGNLTAATWYLTGVQLEAGSVATPFERRPYGTELALCQRYYYRSTNALGSLSFGVGFVNTTTMAKFHINFPVEMRAAPSSLETTGTATNYALRPASGTIVCSGVPTFDNATNISAFINGTVASGLTAGQSLVLRNGSNSFGAFLGFSAEL
jgi:hypothetical protein